MNGSLQQVTSLSRELKELVKQKITSEIVIFPPALYIPLIHEILEGSGIYLGAQNAYPQDQGAFTGELSALMFKEFNCKYLLVGHSERRHLFKEDENFIAQKFHHAKDHGIIPVLCVGETQTEREKGQTEQVIRNQLLAVAQHDKSCFNRCVVAYEPVWAIGTGATARPDQAQDVHQYIRNFVKEINSEDAESLSILYGGSVNENNAKDLFAMADIDGALVGGASLNAKQFVEIVECIN